MSKTERSKLRLKSLFYYRLLGLTGLFALFFFAGCHRHQPVKPKPEPVKYGGPPTSFRKIQQIEKNLLNLENPFLKQV